jgi:hypothetical protein
MSPTQEEKRSLGPYRRRHRLIDVILSGFAATMTPNPDSVSGTTAVANHKPSPLDEPGRLQGTLLRQPLVVSPRVPDPARERRYEGASAFRAPRNCVEAEAPGRAAA